MKKWLLGFLSVVCLSFSVQAQKVPVLDFFHGAECPYCHQEKRWFSELKELYPDVQINEYEVWHNAKNQVLWALRMQELGMAPTSVPTNIIQNEVVLGFEPKSILALLEKHYGPPLQKKAKNLEKKDPPKDETKWKKYLAWSWPLMSFVLGFIDGFNPCAMWSLLVLIGFLLTIESTRKRWLIGGIFLLSSGLIYMGALLAYLFGFSQISFWVATDVMSWIFRVVGFLAIASGALALYSGWKSHQECKVVDGEKRKDLKNRLELILEKKNLALVLAGVVGLAFSVNAIELLCSFAIPTAFTATLVSGGLTLWEQLTAILIYDMAYMLDDVIVFCLAMWTLNVKAISGRLVRYSHFIGGTLLVIIGLALIINPSGIALIFS